LALAFLVVVGVAILFFASSSREPEYAGRTASEWALDFEARPFTLDSIGLPLNYGEIMHRHDKAAEAFEQMGEDALPWLTHSLQWKDSRIENAFRALNDKQSIMTFSFAKPPPKKQYLLYGLHSIGPEAKAAIPVVESQLDFQKFEHVVAETLARLGPDAIPALRRGLTNENHRVRHECAEVLGEFGTQAADAVPQLIRMLDESPGAESVITTLGKIGAAARPAIPLICKQLDAESSWTKRSAIVALGELGPSASECLPRLLALLNNIDLEPANTWDDLRFDLAHTINQIGGAEVANKTLPLMLRFLKTGNANGQASAARVLGKMGADAAEAFPALTSQLNHPKHYVIAAAAKAPHAINAERTRAEILPDMLNALRDSDESTRVEMVRRLCPMASAFDSLIDDLESCFSDESPAIRATAARNARYFESQPKRMLRLLVGCLDDEQDEVLYEAVECLMGLSKAARNAAPTLIRMMDSHAPESDRWRSLMITLETIDPVAAERIEKELGL
jgi:HEAT repeat protein